ncbi:MAG: hypothetical protein RLZZ435_2988 [Cyanobacteriota bacterium]|jgi:hypothetical protein
MTQILVICPPVLRRRNLFLLDTVPIVRVIGGKAV